jgi:non-lysosomal glucosylceramidase
VKLAEAAARVSRSKAVPSDSRLSRASNLRAAEYVYSGEALRAVALPFGAVGGGSIALAGDGGLRQWQINNRVNHAAAVPDSFFAVKTTDASGVTKAVALMSPACYNPSGFTPAPMITDADVPACSIALLEALPSVAELQITAKFPVATVDYLSGEVPVTVSQEVLSPFIPLDSKDSGCPVIFFTFTVSNPTSGPLNVSLMQSQQNIAGWNGLDVITDEVSCDGYGGNTNNLATNAVTGVVTLDMCNPSLDATTDFNGHVAVSVLPTTDAVPHTVSSFAQYAAVTTLWDAFTSAEGLPGDNVC